MEKSRFKVMAAAMVFLLMVSGGLAAAKSAFSRIEGENYSTSSSTGGPKKATEGGESLGFIANGSWARYDGIDFGSEAKTFTANVSSANSGGTIELRLDSSTGKLIGSCTVNGTGGWDKWVNVSCNLSRASGTHDLYLVFKGSKSGYLFNLNYFQLSGSGATSGSSSSSSGSQPVSSGSSYDFGLDEGDHINLPSGDWQSSDSSIVKVSKNGKAVAKGEGIAVLTSSTGRQLIIKVEGE